MTYQFKIELDYSEPTVWRRVTVPANFTFDDFHIVIQIAMGWKNAHLYQFNVGKPYASDSIEPFKDGVCDIGFSEKYENLDSLDTTLSDYFGTRKKRINYVYDMGDDWVHTITREKILKEVTLYPKCIDGEEACPPEDCGGIYGYRRKHEILKNPSHKDYEDTKEWFGLKEDQNYNEVFGFDIEKVNKILYQCTMTNHL